MHELWELKQKQNLPLSEKIDISLDLIREWYEYWKGQVYGDIIQNNNDEYITTKCERTGCMFCMFGYHFEKEPNRFQKMKITHPKLYDYCLRDWDAGGLGIKNVLDYINVKY